MSIASVSKEKTKNHENTIDHLPEESDDFREDPSVSEETSISRLSSSL